MALVSMLFPRSLFKPVSRLALMTFAWNHRHEITRWGRSLYDQLVGRTDVSPARALRTGHLLFAIASDDQLRNAKQLRKVTMVGDTVDLDVDERWSELPRLLARVRRVKGVADVHINGRSARDAPRADDVDAGVTTFEIDLDLRADEDSAFVPSDQLDGARVGDVVTVRSSYLDGTRTGTVAEVIDDHARGRFHRVTFA